MSIIDLIELTYYVNIAIGCYAVIGLWVTYEN